nr:bifunctional tRNA (5-methylaminomethyl-2-thiouridine)(34)-methyltransferase MnmD/FAD-dependent 5-carboxymethylaminomethyl-2-thiouridine(34) oxidoreductase MnmC [Halomonas sp. ML-15]
MTDRLRDGLAPLETARLDWQRDDGDLETPHSLTFGDVYFSRQDGRAETEHVFIDGNDLPRRFREWREARPFVIGETGFGTGLNLLCAWACFRRHATPEARLHLVSTEKYPLTRDDLTRALAAWPELADAAARLAAQWPEPVAGVHRLWLDQKVTLDLHFGDSAECLAALDGRVDAWFLDGFAPSKNPQMWQPALFEAIACHSRPGATFATFTCAGVVKRGLKAVGFQWRKVPGFGRKREMLSGEIETPAEDSARHATPWFTPPAPAPRPAQHVAVIGAGLAGASVAHALARRGVTVTLLDREAPGAGASGNAQGALYIKLAVAPNAHSRLYLAGLLHSRRWLDVVDPEGALWQQSGVLQLANTPDEAERQARFLTHYALPGSVVEGIDAATLASRSGLPPQAFTAEHALDYPTAGWVRPQALCQRLAASSGVRFQHGEVETLTPARDGWRLALADGGTLDADQVVVATAQLSNRFAQTADLPLQPIRGQVSQVRLPEGVPAPTRVICAGGYVPPPADGVLTFGATFAPHDESDETREADHAANLSELARTLPGYVEALRAAGAELDPARMVGRAAVRAASPDKSPYAGPAPDATAWRHDYAALSKDAKRIAAIPGAHHAGLWISTAHGSRGLASAPLCAELIASRICDEPLPLPVALVDQLHPGRRLIRELIRLTRH